MDAERLAGDREGAGIDRPEPPAAVCFALEVFGRKVMVPAADWLAMVRDVTAWNEATAAHWQKKGKAAALKKAHWSEL